MIDRLSTLLHLDDSSGVSLVFGAMPAAHEMSALREMLQARPSAKRHGQGLAITVPVAAGVWHVWLLDTVPSVTDLAALMPRVQELSKGIQTVLTRMAADAGTEAAVGQETLVSRLNARIGEAAFPPRKALARLVLDDLVERELTDGAALLKWSGGKLRKTWLSDERYRGHLDEIRAVAQSGRLAERRSEVIPANSTEDGDLEAAMLAQQCGAPGIAMILPPDGASGYGLLAFGAVPAALGEIAAAVDVMTFASPVRSGVAERRRRNRWAVLAAAAAAIAVFLVLPAPMILTTTGTTLGADVTVAAIPSDSYLRRMDVRVGDIVAKGDPIGEFYSPTIEDDEAEAALSASVERLNAQAALADNEYGAYQLASQRYEISSKRLEHLGKRREALMVRSPAAGRVTTALPGNLVGRHVPRGESVASIQTTPGMLIEIDLSRMDARHVAPGMPGKVHFRGLGGDAWGIRVLTPSTVTLLPNGGGEHITALAQVLGDDTDRLIVGMAGFARLEGPTAPRIIGYGRYVGEFLREKAWIYLGLHF